MITGTQGKMNRPPSFLSVRAIYSQQRAWPVGFEGIESKAMRRRNRHIDLLVSACRVESDRAFKQSADSCSCCPNKALNQTSIRKQPTQIRKKTTILMSLRVKCLNPRENLLQTWPIIKSVSQILTSKPTNVKFKFRLHAQKTQLQSTARANIYLQLDTNQTKLPIDGPKLDQSNPTNESNC